MPNPKPLAPPIQKKLLPDGIPPPQPPEKSPAPGGRQVLRVNRACSVLPSLSFQVLKIMQKLAKRVGGE